MLRVLTLSTLYPNALRPQFGIFVERQTRGLAALPDVEVQVVAARGLPQWPLSLHSHYRPVAKLAARETWNDLLVHRPPFTIWPVVGQRHAATAMARALLPVLRRIRKDFPFDIIDAEFFWPDGVAAMKLAQALGVPFSIKARGSDILHWGGVPGIRAQMVEAAGAANGMLAVSAALGDEMIGLGMPGEKIRVHHTGVDASLFRLIDRAAAKAELGVNGPLIATLGALIELKGQSFALEALAKLESATLILIGDGPDRASLAQKAEALGIAERVRFAGNCPPAQVAHLLGAADLMMLPTRSEGLANAWVEALASGTPVITCAVGAARDVINRPGAGRIVARNGDALAEAASELLARPPSQEAVRAAADRFSWERNAQELRAHLRACAGT